MAGDIWGIKTEMCPAVSQKEARALSFLGQKPCPHPFPQTRLCLPLLYLKATHCLDRSTMSWSLAEGTRKGEMAG